jgi:dihydrofolate synthase/folylpolyglutamate synthase
VNYPDSVRFLYALGNELKTAKFGLERITRLAESLGDPHLRPHRFIHVAGTNGKGSTCAMIESGLRAAGLKTGLFTSPHLVEPTERIRIDGVPVSADEFTAAFRSVHEMSERLIDAGEIDLHPSYFETVFAMALLLFREKKVDVTVLEVGLGGRLDATNIVEPELSVITPVDFDHERFLGNTIESIAAEKAGIVKAGVPVVMAPQRAQAEAVIRERADRLIPAWTAEHVEVRRDGSSIQTHGMRIECNLRGRHQVTNALTAATALDAFGISGGEAGQGIAAARWAGRLERIHSNPEVIVDGAHNPAGARALAQYVDEFYAEPKAVLIFGVMRDKSVEEMAAALFPKFREVIVTAPAQQRSLWPEAFLGLVDHPALSSAPGLGEAIGRAGNAETIFISGSLFLVGEAIEFFRMAENNATLITLP